MPLALYAMETPAYGKAAGVGSVQRRRYWQCYETRSSD